METTDTITNKALNSALTKDSFVATYIHNEVIITSIQNIIAEVPKFDIPQFLSRPYNGLKC